MAMTNGSPREPDPYPPAEVKGSSDNDNGFPRSDAGDVWEQLLEAQLAETINTDDGNMSVAGDGDIMNPFAATARIDPAPVPVPAPAPAAAAAVSNRYPSADQSSSHSSQVPSSVSNQVEAPAGSSSNWVTDWDSIPAAAQVNGTASSAQASSSSSDIKPHVALKSLFAEDPTVPSSSAAAAAAAAGTQHDSSISGKRAGRENRRPRTRWSSFLCWRH